MISLLRSAFIHLASVARRELRRCRDAEERSLTFFLLEGVRHDGIYSGEPWGSATPWTQKAARKRRGASPEDPKVPLVRSIKLFPIQSIDTMLASRWMLQDADSELMPEPPPPGWQPELLEGGRGGEGGACRRGVGVAGQKGTESVSGSGGAFGRIGSARGKGGHGSGLEWVKSTERALASRVHRASPALWADRPPALWRSLIVALHFSTNAKKRDAGSVFGEENKRGRRDEAACKIIPVSRYTIHLNEESKIPLSPSSTQRRPAVPLTLRNSWSSFHLPD